MEKKEHSSGRTRTRALSAIICMVAAPILFVGGLIFGIIVLATTGEWSSGLLILGLCWAAALVSLITGGIIGVATGVNASKSFIERNRDTNTVLDFGTDGIFDTTRTPKEDT